MVDDCVKGCKKSIFTLFDCVTTKNNPAHAGRDKNTCIMGGTKEIKESLVGKGQGRIDLIHQR